MTHTVTSPDGTEIAYEALGNGPGLVILHGAMETGASHRELAETLSPRFTCYLPDRRGRGASGPLGSAYGLDREVEDLAAVLGATGAAYALGVSSGAIITLQAALRGHGLRRVVAFEPPLSVAGSNDTSWLPGFDARIARGDVVGALVIGMKRTKMGPPALNALPDVLLRPMVAAMLRRQDATASPGEPTFRELAPTLHDDVLLVAETADNEKAFATIEIPTLLLGGGKSPAYLKRALAALEPVIPAATRTELPGLSHGATGPTSMGGAPTEVAAAMTSFLLP